MGPGGGFGSSRHPGNWTKDGEALVLTRDVVGRGFDIGLVRRDGTEEPVLETGFDEHQPALSPDGRWMAYVSNETGRDEVYLRPFPGPGGRTPVSSAGGGSPTWSRTGRELFFVEGRQMMVAEIVPGSEMRVGVPRRLFEGAFVWERAGNFDVSVDGRRFLMIEAEQGELAGEARVVLNWFSDLRRLAPPGAR
jgi:hypothetical protein